MSYSIDMDTDRDTKRYIKQSISFPVQQLDWLRDEAERQEHGNLSRVVQDAIREYRNARIAERLSWVENRELERVS